MMTRNSDDVLSRRKFLIASGAAGVAGLAGCTESNTDDGGSGGGSGGTQTDGEGGSGGDQTLSGTIDIAGSSTVFPLATAMAERFQKEHSEVNINIQSTGSGGGFANYFCPGQTDFNNASRPIKQEEVDQCSSNDVEPVELKVATDALTVIVNNDNDWIGEGLTTEQLKTIFSAETKPETWADVNADWPDEPIEIFGPTDASGTYDYFIEAIIGEEGGHRQDYSATEQDRTIIQGVEGSEYAIGYLGFAYYSENTDAVQAVAVENDSGEFVEPSLDNALSGEYNPLSRPLFTYPAKQSLAEAHTAAFATYWLENATSKEIVADEVGYVPLSDSEQTEMLDKLNSAIDEAN